MDLVGSNPYDYFHPADLEAVSASHRDVNAVAERERKVRYRVRHRDGRYVWFESISKQVEADGRILVTSRDVTEQVELSAELERRARRDDLTGLLNRRELFRLVQRELDAYHDDGPSFCLLLVDIDGLGYVNDTHGYEAGDHALKMVARCISEGLRDVDAAARVSGDEFGVLLVDADARVALAFAQRLQDVVSRVPLRREGPVFHVTVGIGGTQASPAFGTTEHVLARVDEALYAAKREGSNRLHVSSATPLREVPGDA